MVSANNPFRTPAVTPNPTGASSNPSGSTIPSHTGPHREPSPSPPPSSQSPDTARSPAPQERSVNDLLTEELPPAYTPAPNVYEGEETLELGPRRPFQNPVPVPPQNQQPPWISPQLTGASWSGFPGGANAYSRPPPPPVHPSMQYGRPSSTPIAADHPVSDFARDFYSAGAGAGADVNAGVLGGPSAQYQNGPSIPDDGRPTDKPVPGHPLLRHGKILVYPKDYECHKCRNTGYKNFDPSHPCSRCWDKYAKPYSGAMAYAPWTPDGPGPPPGVGHARTSFQRPLPQFRAPQASLHGARADLGRSASTSRAGGGYPGAAARVIPVAGGGVPMSPYLDPLQTRTGRAVFPPPSWYGAPPVVPVRGAPPPSGNVAVYSPGDSRIGGRLCWRCGGSGKTSFLIFDEATCTVCNGIGRTFV